ncbi:3-dehydroquinate synthase [Coralloluteibacterium stylophorae]|uniref:3-dehydroquinate synthase n=1 Tax=Coralloluteibacterium stylophorae TaxID=1776034 RepID=A0A8J8AWF9_9GAMM|nr:3-dehydroquinate synthase [Coralloluteibacterium stylophorae]MBS7456408.1 3-dehydroquinate synthase [Coralloluteibacterium stylophorae]
MNPRILDVALGDRSYSIRIGSALLRDAEGLRACAPGRHVLLVTDANVATHHLAPVRAAFAGHAVELVVLPPGEQEKTLARFGDLMAALARLGASRDATVVALGGGVVGDLAGFAAACWMRGVRFVQLPTTLLAMVDSSVGGKTAVDLPEGKNLVGAFHQPAAVVADTDVLATLPDRELRAGLAEVLKYGAIGDPAFFAWLETQAPALLARDPAVLGEAIARSCAHKADVVARDETERGERALLNFGHTFGHAIETVQGYGGLLHGEAVAVGMRLAADLSHRLGRASADDAQRLAELVEAFGLPTRIPPGLDPDALLARMRLDKKNLSGRLRLVLWRALGRADLVDGVDEAAVRALLAEG